MFSHSRKPTRDTLSNAAELGQQQAESAPSASLRHNALERPLHGQPATQEIAARYSNSIPEGGVSGLKADYLSNFIEDFPALRNFMSRRKTLGDLQAYVESENKTVSTDMDIFTILSELLDQKPSAESAANPQTTMPPQATTPQPTSTQQKPPRARPQQVALRPTQPPAVAAPTEESVAVLSSQPSSQLRSAALPPVVASQTLPQAEAGDAVMGLYRQGLLLVTSVQPKDLHLMHNNAARQTVEKHADRGKMEMSGISASPDEVAHAKVNWTLTSPKMHPHYFGMTQDDNDPIPKRENLLGNRIATLVDATHPELLYMDGKKGSLSDWEEDQSSSKTAGVKDGAPLYSAQDPVVMNQLQKIKTQQEEEKRKLNPEINTFGFPPAAVVGFLVTTNSDKAKKAIQAAKAKMSPEQQQRKFPIYTWEATGNEESPWTLVELDQI